MIDYHIHTHHSIDAEGSIDEYCSKAIELGLKEICITNHCELDPLRNDSFIRFGNDTLPFTRDVLTKLQAEVMTAKKFYKKQGLYVKFGIEVGYYDGIEKPLNEILNGIDIDFIIGAIHCLDHICIDSSKEYPSYFPKYSASALMDRYFNVAEKLIKSGLFDSFAHIDVYKKYGFEFYGKEINDFPEQTIRNIFKIIKDNHIGLEINTAGLRRLNEFYPAPSIMKIAREENIKLITVGSDSHRIEDLGKGIKEAIEYAKSFGFEAIFGFDKRNPIGIKI